MRVNNRPKHAPSGEFRAPSEVFASQPKAGVYFDRDRRAEASPYTETCMWPYAILTVAFALWLSGALKRLVLRLTISLLDLTLILLRPFSSPVVAARHDRSQLFFRP